MTDGTQDGRLFFNTMVAGTLTERLRFNGTETALNEVFCRSRLFA